jgi:hypothetical protein
MDVQLSVTDVIVLARVSHVLGQLGNRTSTAQTAISSSQMPTALMRIGGKLILHRRGLNMTAELNDNTALFVPKGNAAAIVWPSSIDVLAHTNVQQQQQQM